MYGVVSQIAETMAKQSIFASVTVILGKEIIV